MIENLPNSINTLFILTTFTAVYLFYRTTNKSFTALFIILSWLLIQGFIGYSKFYTETSSIPPRFFLLVVPPVIFIIIIFLTQKGKVFVDSIDIKMMTYLQTIRIPVEIVLFMLYQNGLIPKLMTFEGRNFDIIAGITAPVVAYFGFTKKTMSKNVILIWNIICLGLVLNIVINAALSVSFPFQQFAFDQPNVAVLYFPFIWLPCCIVPIVILCHLASIRQLILNKHIS